MILAAVLPVLRSVSLIFAAAATNVPAPARAPVGWLQGNRIRLTVTPGGAQRGRGDSKTYTFSIAPGGDMRIALEERSTGAVSATEILLISGRFMAVRGAKLPKGYEIDSLDAAALSWQIAAQILERAAPGDPAALRAPVRIAIAEARQPIHVVTSSAEQVFDPPWSARGLINPIGGSRDDFEIVFSCRDPVPPNRALEMKYTGRWERSRPAPAIDDASSLRGWTVYLIGPHRQSGKDGETVDYSASPMPDSFATLGDLRRSVRESKR